MGRLVFFYLLCFFSLFARASDMSQTIGEIPVTIKVITQEATFVVPAIEFNRYPMSIEARDLGSGLVAVARFQGFSRKIGEGSVSYDVGGKTFFADVSSADGSFVLDVPLRDQDQIIRIHSMDLRKRGFDDLVKVSAYNPFRPNQRLNFDIGVGLSYLDYKETTLGVDTKITELGVTTKGGVNYAIDKKWEIGGNGFVTAFDHSFSSPNEARWFGINGRLGYRLPMGSPYASFHLMGGYYIWGMIVPAGAPYGVQVLGGPQVFFTGRFLTKKRKACYAYVKFASIQDGGLFSITNREVAFGAGYQIYTSINGEHRWMLTGDMTSVKYENALGTFGLLSTTIGISTNL